MDDERRIGPSDVVSPPLAAVDVGDGLGDEPGFDLVDEWGVESFPASDPPQAWCR